MKLSHQIKPIGYLNKYSKVFILLIASTCFSSSVGAFGISSPFWNTNPLELSPGESVEIFFNLQNCPSLSPDCDPVDEEVIVELVEGRKIARITGNRKYLIPFGSHDQYIKMNVKVPKKAQVGDTYIILFTVASLNPATGGGGISIGVKYSIKFSVNVV